MVTIIGIVSTLLVSYISSRKALVSMTKDQLSSLRGISEKRTGDFVHRTKTFTSLLGNDRLTEGLILAYESAFYAAGLSIGKDQVLNKSAFKELNATYKQKINEQLKSYEISNYLLANINGQIVFSAQEDLEGKYAGRNVLQGELKGTGLSRCIDAALKSNDFTVYYSDYEHLKSVDDTAAFFCVKTIAEFPHLSEGIKKGDLMGVVAVELDIHHLTELLSSRDGMGKTGQSFILGSDGFLRSDMFINKDKYNVDNIYRKGVGLNLEILERVKKGEKNNLIETIDVNNEAVLSAFSILDIEGHTWIVISEKNLAEILAPVNDFLKTVIFVSVFILILLSGVGLYFAVKMSSPIIDSVERLTNISLELNKDSEELNDTANVLADSAVGQEKALQSTVQAVDEISATIDQNSENAKNSANVSSSSLETAEVGREVVKKMILTMEEINSSNESMINQVEENNKKISEILLVISEIEDKTKVINDIVFQTKLLSFNASVESARAGEHGKGFAVVAEEVGNLANMSGKSAHEISDLLSESVRKVSSIVEESKKQIEGIARVGKEKVETGRSVARECGDVFDKIYQNFSEVNTLVTEISSASQEQSQGMGAINQAMERLSDGTMKSTTIAKKSSDAAKNLEQRSVVLKETLESINSVLRGNQY